MECGSRETEIQGIIPIKIDCQGDNSGIKGVLRQEYK